MRLLFLHGYGARPGGLKPTFLWEEGHKVINPGLPSEDFEESARIAQEVFDRTRPELVVGSSRGGAVAVNMDRGEVPLLLIAPAWKKWGTATTVKKPVVILHSQSDDVVPIADSRELLENSRLPMDHLVVVGDDHSMSDKQALAALADAVKQSNEG